MGSTSDSSQRRLQDLQPKAALLPQISTLSRGLSHTELVAKPATKLLFIDHYDETRQPSIRKLAYAHVQHNRNRHRRLIAIERLRHGSHRAVHFPQRTGARDAGKPNNSWTTQESEGEDGKASSHPEADVKPASGSPKSGRKAQSMPLRKCEGQVQTQVIPPRPKPQTVLDQSDPDPFSSGATPIPRGTHFLLRHYAKYMAFFLSCSRAYSDAHNHWLVPITLEEPLILNSVSLMAVANLRQLRKGLPGTDRVLEDQLLRSKINLIRAINDSLDQPVETLGLSTFYGMYALLVVEILGGSIEAAMPHINGLVKLGQLKGGFSSLPRFFVGQVLMYQNGAALITKTKPCITPPPMQIDLSPPTQALIQAGTDPSLKILASGFAAASPSILEPEMLEVLNATAEETVVTLFLREHDTLMPLSDLRATQQRKWYFHYKRLAFPFRKGRQDDQPAKLNTHKDAAQECCRLATSLFTLGLAKGLIHSSSPAIRSTLAQLREVLDRTDLHTLWHPHEEMLLWVLVMAANWCRGRPEHAWFIAHLARGAKIIGVNDMEELRHVLFRFLYTDYQYSEWLQQTWADVKVQMDTMPA